MAEAGIKGVEMNAWYGLYMPAGTPKAVQEKIQAETAKLLEAADTRTRLASFGAVSTPMTQVQFQAFHNAENQKYADLIKRRGIKVD
jgi:tripartite-type tricarboxylate transporter receptor subunit TctC